MTVKTKCENYSPTLVDHARSRFWLAPMAGITDVCYRQLMDELGTGLVISELVSAKGLLFNSEKTRRMMRIHKNPGVPVGIQVFGEAAEDIVRIAPMAREAGAEFIDINLGCPVKKVVQKGCGAALLRDPVKLEQFLTAIKRNIDLPLTVKMRTGWNEEELTIHECVDAATQAGCVWVAIHGRTRAQGYEGQANWDLIREVKQKAKIPIIGNGDIRSVERAHARLEETGVDAVMIGRGALRNPWIFLECAGKMGEARRPGQMRILNRFRELLEENYDTRRTLLALRKFAAWMAFGYPGAAALRGKLFSTTTTPEVLDLAGGFFASVQHLPAPHFDDSEAFLMGGHG